MPEEIYEIIRGAVGARKRAGRVPECVLRLNMLKQHPQLHARQWDQAVAQLVQQGRITVRPTYNDISYYVNQEDKV